MFDSFSLLPFALAARGGRVDDFEVQQLVAAGITLLQRGAPIVRALHRKRAAIVLPSSPAFVVALAASEGRGAVLIDPSAGEATLARQIEAASVGLVFTNTDTANRLPTGAPYVLLDDMPRRAAIYIDGTTRDIDLGSHVGLSLEGNTEVEGSDDEAVVTYESGPHGPPTSWSHRQLLAEARELAAAIGETGARRIPPLGSFAKRSDLVAGLCAPLLVGATVLTRPHFDLTT